MMKRARTPLACGLALGALTLGVVPVRASAQAAAVNADRGWVGISFDIETMVSEAGQRTRVLITDVSEDSPAAKAGVRAGDLLVSINGHGLQDQFGGITSTVHAGDPVTIVLERDGRRRNVRMTAVARPAQVEDTPRWTLTVGRDSMVDVMFRAMDSLRLQLVQGSDGVVRVLAVPGADGTLPSDEARTGTVRLRSVGGDPLHVFGRPGADSVTVQLLPEVRPPFSFFVFRGDRTDSLQSEMDRLNQQIRDLRARRTARLHQIETARPGSAQVGVDDPELIRLSRALDDVGRQATDLRATMERVAREEAQGLYEPPEAGAGATSRWVPFRPLTPYLLGQNRAAGAEVVNLRPELAEYFKVDGGVLVVDVPEGTPAALAGVQPGDVLTHVDGRPIRSIQELRVGLAKPGTGPLPLALVRKGRELEVLLRR